MGRLGPFLWVAALALPTHAVLAQDEAVLDDPAVAAFVVNNTIGTLYHEIGHAFVDLYRLPVLGREEDAADSLSTLLMLEEQPDEVLDQMMLDASDVYWLSDAESQQGGYLPDYSDVHGLDLQRYYAMVCVVYGSDPERFQELADYAELEPERQESCSFDYTQAYDSWWQLLEPHLQGNEEAAGSVQLVFDEPAPENAALADLAQGSAELEQTVADLNDVFALPQDLVVRFAECDEENAWYDPADQSITMCYQIMASFLRLAQAGQAAE
ncbi:MAG: DUF4344 domain-containing metallopeptidase [Alphaproteobacteria bacterium]